MDKTTIIILTILFAISSWIALSPNTTPSEAGAGLIMSLIWGISLVVGLIKNHRNRMKNENT